MASLNVGANSSDNSSSHELRLEKILASKRALRRELAARPIAEKLRMLDALRERTLTLRSAPASNGVLRETPAPYRNKPA